MKRITIYSILLGIFLSSCFKDDEMIIPHDPGELIESEVILGEYYTDQVYFDLSTEMAVAENNKDIWDMEFESSPFGWHVLLNSACFMYAAGTGSEDFSAAIDTTGYHWKYDPSDGKLDSTAIGNYFSHSTEDSTLIYTNEVFVINRGYDAYGIPRGLKKIVFQEVNDSAYLIRFAGLDGSDEHSMQISKDSTTNFSYFSFDDGGKQLYLEPAKRDYDLLFTRYTTLLYTNAGDPYDYILTGVLLNRHTVEAVRDTSMDFNEITYESTTGMNFSNHLDIIGYDWKEYTDDQGGSNGVYLIVEGLYYIIRDTEGYLYKLRFTSFYDNNGVKGTPRFEYQRL